MTEMKKKALLEKATEEGRKITTHGGYVRDAKSFKPQQILIHDWVYERVAEADKLQDYMKLSKLRDFEEFELIRDLLLETYNARLGGTRGGAELESLDGLRKVQLTTTDHKSVTPAIVAAEELVREVMDDLLGDASSDLRQVVDRAFVRNRQTGKISTARIIGLMTLDIDHPKWPDAQRSLRDAIEKGGMRRYMRFYRRENTQSPWELIDLNYSSLEA